MEKFDIKKNVLINMDVEGGDKPSKLSVLAHDLQIDAMSDKIMHVDFLNLNMNEEIKTKVQIVLKGEATGVKLDGGILVHSLRQIEVRCLPNAIPDSFIVDVTPLKIGDLLHVGDIVPPKGVTILSHKDESVVIISSPMKEEAAQPGAAAAVVGAVATDATAAAPAAGAAATADKGKAAPAAADKAKPAAKPAK